MNEHHHAACSSFFIPGKTVETSSRAIDGSGHVACFLDHLKAVRRNGSGYLARCPAHDDRNPSLSISVEGDRILLHCFAGCSADRITDALGLTLSDLFLNPHTPARQWSRRRQRSTRPSLKPVPRHVESRDERCTALFEFYDEEGRVVAEKRRYDFIACYNDGSEERRKRFIVQPSGLQLPLYELPAVLSAVRQRWDIYLLEGEAKADLLNLYIREEWGLNAVATSYGGHWRTNMAPRLRGVRVVVVPDRDDAGKRHALRVIRDLHNAGITPELCDISNILAAMEAEEGRSDGEEVERP